MQNPEPGILYRCTLDGLELDTSDPTVTPIQLKAMAGVDQSRIVFQLIAHDERHLAENETVDLPEHGMERFISRAATEVAVVAIYRIQLDGVIYPSRTAHLTVEAIRQIGGLEPSAPVFQLLQGQRVALQAGQVVDLTPPGTEQFTIHAHDGDLVIIINGRPETVQGTRLTYDQLIHLAFPTLPIGENVVFTMTYRLDGAGSPLKSVAPGATVHIKEGTSFNVAYTDKS